jgi:glycosyltransferase involved in cell wall biosynthesis
VKVLVDLSVLGVRGSGLQHAAIAILEALGTQDDVEVSALSAHPLHSSLPPGVRLVRHGYRVPVTPLPWTLARTARLDQFDVLHCSSVLPPFLRKPRTAKVVMTLHDVIALAYPQWVTPATRWFFRAVLPGMLRKVDRVVTDSEWSRSEIEKFLPGARSRVEIVSLALRWPVSETLSIGPQPYFLAVGNFEPRKNLSHVVEAFRMVRSLRPELRLIVVGKPSTGFSNQIGQLQKEGVELAGYVDDERLRSLYREAIALVFPSLYEGFGFPVLEAMSQGCPVICSGTTSLPEVGGGAVLFTDPGDPARTAELMQEVLITTQLREELALRGQARARLFTPQRMGAELMRVYRDVLA